MQDLVDQFSSIKLSFEDRCTIIQLNCAKGFGGGMFRRLMEHFESIENLRYADRESILNVRGIGPKIADSLIRGLSFDVRQEFDHATKHGYDVITIFDKEYPKALLALYDPPLALFIKGKLLKEDQISIAIVGSRSPTTYGKYQAERFSLHLAASGFTIVSGLANGIDTCAHRGALHAKGRTIAILGHGHGKCYPADNQKLMEQITENGAVISEYLFNTPPKTQNFPHRNRIVAALSLGVFVVEARINSGSLITSRFGIELGREIFALPGPVNSPESEGTHKLIIEGARLVQKPEDILEELGEMETILKPVMSAASKQMTESLNEDEKKVVAVLGKELSHIDDLHLALDYEISELLSYLTLLEIKGILKSHPGRYFSLV